MDDNKKDNAWDELLQDLGAQPEESAFKRHQPPPQEIPPTVDWEESEALVEQAKPSPSDWSSLAESLGLEVEDPPPKEIESAVVESVAENVGQEVEVEADLPSEQLTHEASVAPEDEPEQSSFEKAAAEEPGDPVEPEELPPLPSQMDQAMYDTTWQEEASAAGDTTEGETDQGHGSEGHGMSGEAARSAFDALFADGASTWGSAFLPTPKPGDPSPVPTSSTVENMFDTPEPRDNGEEGDGNVAEGDDSEKPKRKRSRRRRRGGRGRKSTADTTAEGDAIEENSVAERDEQSDELTEDSSDRPKRSRRRRSGQRTRPQDADLEGGEEGLESEEGDHPRGAGRGRQRHRNIPTWTEAIGMIVDSNLEQRAKSPSKPQSSRGGRGRGGRGGRRRGGGKKSENN